MLVYQVLAVLVAAITIQATIGGAAQERIGVCNDTYTKPSDLIWLTSNNADCIDGFPCEHKIVAPLGFVVKLNFTRLSGLEYTEYSSDLNSYDLIEGPSSCQPRIEVTDQYVQSMDVQTTTKHTLCYDRIYGSSVVIITKSHQVVVSVYCLARKYSFFSMNFSFFPKPVECSLACHNLCLQVHQLCNGIHDCPHGEDEQDCESLVNFDTDPLKPTAPSTIHKDYLNATDTWAVPVFCLAATLLVLVAIVTIIVICRRKRVQFESGRTMLDGSVEGWDESHNISTPLTQELLHCKEQETCSPATQRNAQYITAAAAASSSDSNTLPIEPTNMHRSARQRQNASTSAIRTTMSYPTASPASSSSNQLQQQNTSSSYCSSTVPSFPTHVKNSADGEYGYERQQAELRHTNQHEQIFGCNYGLFDGSAPPNQYPFDSPNGPNVLLTLRDMPSPPPYSRHALLAPPSYEMATDQRHSYNHHDSMKTSTNKWSNHPKTSDC